MALWHFNKRIRAHHVYITHISTSLQTIFKRIVKWIVLYWPIDDEITIHISVIYSNQTNDNWLVKQHATPCKYQTSYFETEENEKNRLSNDYVNIVFSHFKIRAVSMKKTKGALNVLKQIYHELCDKMTSLLFFLFFETWIKKILWSQWFFFWNDRKFVD